MIQRSSQLLVFLENRPGELSRLAHFLGDNNINILAMSIQDPVEYIRGLFQARQHTMRRIASAASYGSILREAALFTLIRFVTSDPDRSVKILSDAGYNVETQEVITTLLDNQPGGLASLCDLFVEKGINIDCTYGSALDDVNKSLFVFRVSDIEKAMALLEE